MKNMLVIILTVIFLSPTTSLAKANCLDVYKGNLLRKEAWRARRSAASVFVGVFAISPLVTPLGAVTFGSFAVALLASGSGMHILNKKKIVLPKAVKQYMLVDEVMNPGQSLHLEDYTNQVLFGRPVGYKYDFKPETKKKLLASFVEHLKEKFQRKGAYAHQVESVTDESVRKTILQLMGVGNELCTNKRGKEKALMMFKFENVILDNLWQPDQGIF